VVVVGVTWAGRGGCCGALQQAPADRAVDDQAGLRAGDLRRIATGADAGASLHGHFHLEQFLCISERNLFLVFAWQIDSTEPGQRQCLHDLGGSSGPDLHRPCRHTHFPNEGRFPLAPSSREHAGATATATPQPRSTGHMPVQPARRRSNWSVRVVAVPCGVRTSNLGWSRGRVSGKGRDDDNEW